MKFKFRFGYTRREQLARLNACTCHWQTRGRFTYPIGGQSVHVMAVSLRKNTTGLLSTPLLLLSPFHHYVFRDSMPFRARPPGSPRFMPFPSGWFSPCHTRYLDPCPLPRPGTMYVVHDHHLLDSRFKLLSCTCHTPVLRSTSFCPVHFWESYAASHHM